jgi:glycosyltransferase involved in cell wall biosynthesis
MSQFFQEYFRCPDSYSRFFVQAQSPAHPEPAGNRLGPAENFPAKNALAAFLNNSDGSHNGVPPIRIEGQNVILPFDLDQLAVHLRNEVYVGLMEAQFTRLGTNPVLRKLYYWTRPMLPVSIRSTLQRVKLHGKLGTPFPKWPIDRSVDQLFEKMMTASIQANGGHPIPFIWFWPQGRQAAFILTHDVEDVGGKDFCSSLMDIDDEYGFKASFQVIPEERYAVEPHFLQEFRDRNFDICVHDLNHDGDLYREYSEFKRRAKQINNYCRTFGARGFRSGVLYRNLRWYGEYDFDYDMSVPNVGHLDPQGGGCCTVMPYFIGKVLEIPVTLTQDYSLFYILHQYSIDLWKQQIQAVTDGHGLASVIVHPDYVIEPEQQRLFRSFLVFMRQQVTSRNIWAALPSQVNRWWRQRSQMKLVSGVDGWRVSGEGSEAAQVAYARLVGNSLVYSFTPPTDIIVAAPSASGDARPVSSISAAGGRAAVPSIDLAFGSDVDTIAPEIPAAVPSGTAVVGVRSPLRVAMVSYSFYETDNRVLRYASTLAKRGDHVDVFALRREGKPAEEEMEGVHVHRLQGRVLNEKSQISYAWRIGQFLARAAIQVAKYDLQQRYDILHIHSVPDFMVLSAILPKLRGTPVILDIHDILPEFYVSKFAAGNKSGLFRILVGVERASCRFASHVIIANDIWRDRLLSRSLTADKCTVVLNSPDRSIFTRSPKGHPQSGKFLMLYPGSLNWHQGLDVAIRAFASIRKRAPQAEFHIYGDGPSKPELLGLVKELGAEDQIKMPSARSLLEIAKIMETASLGIVPKRKDNFGNEAFSTKILEFMAMGVPVIVADTMIDKFYFNDSVVKFFESGNVDDLARCMMEMIENQEGRRRQTENASRFVDTVDWSARRHEYLELIDKLTVHSGS